MCLLSGSVCEHVCVCVCMLAIDACCWSYQIGLRSLRPPRAFVTFVFVAQSTKNNNNNNNKYVVKPFSVCLCHNLEYPTHTDKHTRTTIYTLHSCCYRVSSRRLGLRMTSAAWFVACFVLVFCFQLLLLFLANKKPQRGEGRGMKEEGVWEEEGRECPGYITNTRITHYQHYYY